MSAGHIIEDRDAHSEPSREAEATFMALAERYDRIEVTQLANDNWHCWLMRYDPPVYQIAGQAHVNDDTGKVTYVGSR